MTTTQRSSRRNCFAAGCSNHAVHVDAFCTRCLDMSSITGKEGLFKANRAYRLGMSGGEAQYNHWVMIVREEIERTKKRIDRNQTGRV